MIININQNNLNTVDYNKVFNYISWIQDGWFTFGQNEPYKLLAYISSQLPYNAKCSDLGTYYGASAAGLGYNTNIQVTTYDIVSIFPPDNTLTILKSKNIKFVLDDAFLSKNVDTMIDNHVIYLDIESASSTILSNFVNSLISKRYRGLLVVDDIIANENVRDFWNNKISITLSKYDVTKYGHNSGTGILVFDRSFIDVNVS